MAALSLSQTLLTYASEHWKLLILSGAAAALLCYRSFIYKPFYPTLPLVGEPPGRRWFSLRNRLRYYNDCSSLFEEAYHSFVKKGRAVVVPSIGPHSEMVMPENAMDWAMSQPDTSLSVVQAFLDLNQTVYSLGHRRYWGDPWQFQLVKTHLNSILQTLIPQLNDELGDAFDRHLGVNTGEWKEIHLEHTMRQVIAQASSRFIVGLPLCRNDDYLDLTYRVIDGMMTTIWSTIPLPAFLRPITGPIAGWRTQRVIAKIKTHLEPLYKERLAILSNEGNSGDTKKKENEPQDLLMMMLRFAQKKRPRELHNLDIITRRVCASSFVAMHQSTIAATNTILNIIGSDDQFDTISVLRKEAAEILGEGDSGSCGGGWTKDKFAQMIKCDSVTRESMRLNFPFGTRGSMRKVMRDGIETPEGLRLQKGTTISWLASCAQTDPERFENPRLFDPFRFSRAVAQEHPPPASAAAAAAAAASGSTPARPDAFTTTSPQYLPFGHGKHACPGRFMVDFELKMIISHLLRNYDLAWPAEYRGKQPLSVWQGELSIPPPGARIMVKRRSA